MGLPFTGYLQKSSTWAETTSAKVCDLGKKTWRKTTQAIFGVPKREYALVPYDQVGETQYIHAEYNGFNDTIELAVQLKHGLIGYTTCWMTTQGTGFIPHGVVAEKTSPLMLHASVMGTVHAEMIVFPDGAVGIRGRHAEDGKGGIMNKLYLGSHGNAIGGGPFYDRASMGAYSSESMGNMDFLLMKPGVNPLILANGDGTRVLYPPKKVN